MNGSSTRRAGQTVAKMVCGVVFVALGVILLVKFLPSTINTIEKSIISTINLFVDAASRNVSTVPVILIGFSNLVSAVAGLFMVLAGLSQLVGKNSRFRISSATEWMVFGLALNVITLLIYIWQTGRIESLQDIFDLGTPAFDTKALVLQVLVLAGALVFQHINSIQIKKRHSVAPASITDKPSEAIAPQNNEPGEVLLQDLGIESETGPEPSP